MTFKRFFIIPHFCYWPSYQFSQFSFLCQPSFPDVFVCVCLLCMCCWPCSRACGLCAGLRLCGTSPAGLRLGGVPGLTPARARTSGRLHPAYSRRHTQLYHGLEVGGRGTRTSSLAKTRLQTQCLVTQPCEPTVPVSERSPFTNTSKWMIFRRIQREKTSGTKLLGQTAENYKHWFWFWNTELSYNPLFIFLF